MEKKQSILKSLLLRVHYKASIAIIAVLLVLSAVSGFYFFGKNIVNEAEIQQRIARIQVNDSEDGDFLREDFIQSDEETAENREEEDTISNIGGNDETAPISPFVSPKPEVTASPSAQPSLTPTPIAKIAAENFILGDPNAEIAILAYYSFECVYCAKFFNEIFPQIKQEYIDTGVAKVLFKNFPLSNHKAAPIAHNAALCAANEGEFWNYHDLLFGKQSEWMGKSDKEVNELMKGYANDLSLNIENFSKCLESKQYNHYISTDKSEGMSRGVNGTPTFIIGENIIVGAQPFESFKAVIEEEQSK